MPEDMINYLEYLTGINKIREVDSFQILKEVFIVTNLIRKSLAWVS